MYIKVLLCSIQAAQGESALVLEPVDCREKEWEGWSKGRREGKEVGTIILLKDGEAHPAAGDAVVQLEILLPTSGNQWLCYCQIPGLWCLDTKVLMLISANAGVASDLRPACV